MATRRVKDKLAHAPLPFRRRRDERMAMPNVQRRWTAADLARLPYDGQRYEVIDGALYVTPAPSLRHQEAAFVLAMSLREYLDRERVGHVFMAPADVQFSPTTVVQPDVLVMPLVDARRPEHFAEVRRLLVAIEVLSPGTARADRVAKRVVYREGPVDQYWLVDLDARTLDRSLRSELRPEVLPERLAWHPAGAATPFILDVPAYFARVLDR
jgi:Uma2 family endonuclease